MLTTFNSKQKSDIGSVAGAPRAHEVGSRAIGLLKPFLRIPPFPGSRQFDFEPMPQHPSAQTILDGLPDQLRRLQVGGSYWGAQPKMPDRFVLVRSDSALSAAETLFPGVTPVLWPLHETGADLDKDLRTIRGDCDPWHVVANAVALITDDQDELRIIARCCDVPVFLLDRNSQDHLRDEAEVTDLLGTVGLASGFENPFTGEPMDVCETVGLCAFWRRLIDANRDIGGGLGFAFWKQPQIAVLLWDGSRDFRFLKSAGDAAKGQAVAVWRARTSAQELSNLERARARIVEVEDGFLRSNGLGADCIPPLSITVDRLGAYFDPKQPNELELLLEQGGFDDDLLQRARRLRSVIVETGLSKYESGIEVPAISRPAGGRTILVPGQVEDDRAVQIGGCGLVANVDLLRRVRRDAPDAYIIYKPHPDVVAGHRRGTVSELDALESADEIVTCGSIAALIDEADEVHVNTSLAGFEALMRGKRVTTHGVPFYAGWGLTRDLGPPQPRRTARRTLDELVAATLLLYPRYLDPLTGLPCPAEVVVERLRAGDDTRPGVVVTMRRLQGRIKRSLRTLFS